jgi:hypothetical protein
VKQTSQTVYSSLPENGPQTSRAGANVVQIDLRLHLPTHKFEQNDDPFIIGRALKPADMIGKRASHNLYFRALLERHFASGKNEATFVFVVLYLLDDSGRDCNGALFIAYQMGLLRSLN